MNLPPINIPFVADLTKLIQGFAQAQQMGRTAVQPITIPVQIQMGNVSQQIGALTTQMNALKLAITDTSNASGQSRTQIAGLTADNVRLRTTIAQTTEALRAKGVSLKDIAAATSQLRSQLQANTLAISQERVALAQSTDTTRQQRAALADLRTELGAAQKAYNDLAKSAAQAQRDQSAQAKASKDASSGGFLGGLASRAVGSSLNYGVAFGVGAAVGSEVFKTVTASATAATDAVIGFNASLEQSKVAFATFLGGAEPAAAFLKQLQQFAVATPFEFPELVDASKRLLAFGFAAQQVLPLLTAIGNQASAVGLGADGINRLTLALGQMQAKGHVSGEELRQLSEAGVQLSPIFAEVGKQLDITAAQATELADKGNLSSKIFIDAFQKVSQAKFGDLMAAQSQTFSGAMSNIHDAVRIFLAEIGQPLFTAVSKAAQQFANFLQTPQFAAWAQQAVIAVQSVITVLGTLIGAIGRAVTALTGFKMPQATPQQTAAQMASGVTEAAKVIAAAQTDQASAERDITKEIIAQQGALDDAAAKQDEIKVKVDANKDAQEAVNESIAKTSKQYDDVITKLERQVQDIDRLQPKDIANQVQSAQIQQQIIDVKINMPDTTEMEHTLRTLQRAKEDLGNFDSSPWDAQITKIRDQIQALSNQDLKELDDAIRKVQDQITEVGNRNNDDLDAQLKKLQGNIDALSDAGIKAADKQINALRDQISSLNTDDLDKKIEDIQTKLNAPPPDFTNMNSQLAAQAALIQSGAGGSAQAAFAGLSLQKQQMVDATRNQQTGLKAQLASLEAERTAQKQYNQDTQKALEGQIKDFEAQKQAIQDSNDAQKAGWQDQIKAIQEIKDQRERTNRDDRAALEAQLRGLEETKRLKQQENDDAKQAAQAELDRVEKEKQAAQDAFKAKQDALDVQITATQRAIQDAKQPAEDQIAALTRQKEMVDLDQQRRDLARQILDIPLKQQIEDEKRAKEDALVPDQERLQLLQQEGKELDSQARKAEIEHQKAMARIDELNQQMQNLGKPPTTPGAGTGGTVIPPDANTNADAFGGKLKEILDLVNQVSAAMTTFFTWLSKELEDTILPDLDSFWKVLHDHVWPDLSAFISGLTGINFDSLDHRLSESEQQWYDIGHGVRDRLAPLFENAWGTISGIIEGALKGIDGVHHTWAGIWNRNWDEALGGLEKTFSGGWEIIKSTVGGAIGVIVTLITGENGYKLIEKKTGEIFGENGSIGKFFNAFGTTIHDWFAQGGKISGYIAEFDTMIAGFFGEGGTIGKTFSAFGTWMQTNVVDPFKKWFGAGGDIATWFSEFGSSVNDWFGPGQKIGTIFSNFGTAVHDTFDGITKSIDTWVSDHFDGWTKKFQEFTKGLGDAFSGIGEAIASNLEGPAKTIGNFFDVLGKGVHWLSQHFPGVKDIPDYVPPPLAIPGHAEGLTDAPAPGHWAMVGERGPEAMFVPPGSTIVPNHVTTRWGLNDAIPGHAEGLNFDFLGDALGHVTSFIKGSAEKAVNAIMDKIGAPDIPVIPELGKSVFDLAKSGLLSFLKPQEVAPPAPSGGGGGLSQLVSLIKASAAKYNIPPEIIGAIILHESGGIIGRVEVGGGKGRGLMQVDGGTWPQAYDPRMVGTSMDDAAYQIDIGSMILKKAFDASGGDVSGALTNYAGSGFASVHGHTFYQELQQMGLIEEALNALNNTIEAGGDGWQNVLQAAQSMMNDPTLNGPQWNLLCEKFAEQAERVAGYEQKYWTTALAHAEGVPHNEGWGPPGSMQHWGSGYYSQGHAAINVDGAGKVIGTSPSGIAVYTMGNARDNRGWIPPGLANGAYITSPTLAVVGEGGEPEVVSPESKLRQIVGEESGGVSVHFEEGAISVDANGNTRVDASKITVSRTLTRAAQAKGVIIGVSQ